jgi:S1-C subfamily serine protease
MAQRGSGRFRDRTGGSLLVAAYALIVALIAVVVVLSPLAIRPQARAGGLIADATLDEAKSGVVVTSLRTGGEAARAGLRTGDDIVAIDHHRVRSRRDAAHLLRRHRGRSVSVDIARGGHHSRVRLILAGETPHGA